MWYLKVFKPLLEHIVHTINTSLMVFKTKRIWNCSQQERLFKSVCHRTGTEIRIELVCCFLPQQIAAYFSVIVKIFEHPVNMLPVLVHFTSFHGTVLCPKKMSPPG